MNLRMKKFADGSNQKNKRKNTMRRPKSYHIEDSDSPNELEAQKAK